MFRTQIVTVLAASMLFGMGNALAAETAKEVGFPFKISWPKRQRNQSQKQYYNWLNASFPKKQISKKEEVMCRIRCGTADVIIQAKSEFTKFKPKGCDKTLTASVMPVAIYSQKRDGRFETADDRYRGVTILIGIETDRSDRNVTRNCFEPIIGRGQGDNNYYGGNGCKPGESSMDNGYGPQPHHMGWDNSFSRSKNGVFVECRVQPKKGDTTWAYNGSLDEVTINNPKEAGDKMKNLPVEDTASVPEKGAASGAAQ